jgi:hypothetical protein
MVHLQTHETIAKVSVAQDDFENCSLFGVLSFFHVIHLRLFHAGRDSKIRYSVFLQVVAKSDRIGFIV